MLETQVRSLGQEDPLEKEMATHSRTLAWKIPWTEEPGGLQSMGPQSDTTEYRKERDMDTLSRHSLTQPKLRSVSCLNSLFQTPEEIKRE